MTSVQRLPVVRAKGTVMMTQNAKDHLFVDTRAARIVQLQTVAHISKFLHM